MPNKTIYVKDADLRLFEQAQAQLGESISSSFADFLRERIASLTPEEHRILDFLHDVQNKRQAMEKGAPDFLAGQYGEAEAYAEKALRAVRDGDIRKTKIFYFAANTYRDMAERDVAAWRELAQKLETMLAAPAPARKRKK